MIELRQRSKSGDGYSRVSTDDEDEVPRLSVYTAKAAPKQSSNTCLKFFFVFSLSGILFLSVVAFLLYSNSLYFKVSANTNKQELVRGVSGAIGMYCVCTVVAGYFLFRSRTSRPISPRFAD